MGEVSDFKHSIPLRSRLSVRLLVGSVLIIGFLFAISHAYAGYRSYQEQKRRALGAAVTLAQLTAFGVLEELSHEQDMGSGARRLARNAFRAALSIDKSRKQDSIAYTLLLDPDGAPVEGVFREALLPKNLRDHPQAKLLERLSIQEGLPHIVVKKIPIRLSKNGDLRGTVMVGVSTQRLERDLRRSISQAAIFLVIILALLITYLSMTLHRWVVSPIQEIGQAMNAVEQGDFSVQLEMKREDELGRLAHAYNIMTSGLREREHLKDAFNRYVSPHIYDLYRSGQITFDGEQREATVLFSDIRGFTSLSEASTPTEVVSMLNEYFKDMVDVVHHYDGYLNKFIGDAIMAIYNVPGDQDQPEYRAVKTALDMISALERLNTSRAERHLNAISIGIGINTGAVVAGNIGHPKRMEYTVIGDAVNLAQRIESHTKAAGFPLLISESTHAKVGHRFRCQELEPVHVKGKSIAVRLYAVFEELGSQAA